MGVAVHVRETFESAMAMGEAALLELGVPPEEVAEVIEDVRRRDVERFKLELVGGVMAGVDLLRGNMQRMKQTPLTPPKRPAQPLSEETAAVAKPAASPQSPEPVGNAAAPKVEE
jgi:glutathione-regulated potassium-efflux system protein KefB